MGKRVAGMTDKTTTIEDAVAVVNDGMTVLIGGFGVPGTPFSLIEELVRQGQKGLTLVKNDANETGMGIDLLLKAGQVERLIVSHIGLNPHAGAMMHQGSLAVEFSPQGILAERIRAGGAGLIGFLTDIGLGTELGEGKPQVEVAGQPSLIETALKGDVAFIHCHQADPFGNLRYQATAQNFNPLMATAATTVIAEAEEIVDLGGIAPDTVHTPGPFVDHVVPIPKLSESYGVVVR